MRHPQLLDRKHTALVVIDVQERLVKAIPQGEWLTNIARLAQAAGLLRCPVLLTEQYPRGLGPTVPEVREALGEHAYLEKLAFSACGEEAFVPLLRQWNADQVLVCGIEAHVCVQQTTLDLLLHGYQVHVAGDAVASRVQTNWELGVEKMRWTGAVITSTEMALFELLETAAAPEFKAVQALIK